MFQLLHHGKVQEPLGDGCGGRESLGKSSYLSTATHKVRYFTMEQPVWLYRYVSMECMPAKLLYH